MHYVQDCPTQTAQAITEVRRSRQSPPPRWQLVTLGLLSIILYHSVLIQLISTWWRDPNFSHGFFVPLFSLFVIWRERERLAKIPGRPSNWGVAVVAISLVMLVIGTLGAELFLARSSFVFLLAGLVITFGGWALFKRLLFPWVVLFLMIPIPAIIFNQITFPLQLLASEMSTFMLRFLGVPVLREGNVIRLPVMPLEVAEACSGIRSLISLGTLAVIYGYLQERRTWARLVLFLSAIPISVLANGLRITGTGLVAQYWDPSRAEGFFHQFSGWIIFLVSLTMLFLLHSLLQASHRRSIT